MKIIIYGVFVLFLIAIVFVIVYQFLFRYDQSSLKKQVLSLEQVTDDFYLSEESYTENMIHFVYPKLEK